MAVLVSIVSADIQAMLTTLHYASASIVTPARSLDGGIANELAENCVTCHPPLRDRVPVTGCLCEPKCLFHMDERGARL